MRYCVLRTIVPQFVASAGCSQCPKPIGCEESWISKAYRLRGFLDFQSLWPARILGFSSLWVTRILVFSNPLSDEDS